ncbi:MAG: AmmeMemoRadiSam system protein A [Nitrosomonas sp.]|nr:AmmeMemoRadiSam system protein A [Nitrosomonas sp.]MDP1950214.1 AmmeMemoRadiSam system protein A [Nitrosomonas sp.]
MSPEQGKQLLRIARATICSALNAPYSTSEPVDETALWLTEPGATFVTLTQHGGLRGCIGTLQAHRPLLIDVKSNAVSAALCDPRFLPLTRAEFAEVSVEVSLLTAPQSFGFTDEADALAQLRPGTDGLVFEYGQNRSTFLPQVWESLPQPQLFLAELKRKAGLSRGFWAEGIKLSRYTVTKWCESDVIEEYSNG